MTTSAVDTSGGRGGATVREQTARSKGSSLIGRIDAELDRRVLVSGSIPPAGRDLDLIVRRPERDVAARVLGSLGFLPRGRAAVPTRRLTEQWARFTGPDVEIVDLNPAERWNLAPSAVDDLFRDAIPIGNLRNLARPSPPHTLLLLSRRLASEGVLTSKRLSRLPEIVGRDPDVWKRAEAIADDWHAREAIAHLHQGWVLGVERLTYPRRRRFLQRMGSIGPRSFPSRILSEASARRPRAPKVVAFSGLDGAGKSSQVRALKDTLERLGVAVVDEWKPLGHNASIRAMRRAIKRVVAAARGLNVSDLDALKAPGRSLVAGPEPALLHRQNAALTHAWATLVALASAAHYRYTVLHSFGTGRVVLFDRYGLDTVAQLRFFYGEDRRFSLQRGLVRAVCPRPALALFLELPAEVAFGRKPEQYDLKQLERQAALLREESIRLGVRRIDGTRPMEDIQEDVARALWRALRR